MTEQMHLVISIVTLALLFGSTGYTIVALIRRKASFKRTGARLGGIVLAYSIFAIGFSAMFPQVSEAYKMRAICEGISPQFHGVAQDNGACRQMQQDILNKRG